MRSSPRHARRKDSAHRGRQVPHAPLKGRSRLANLGIIGLVMVLVGVLSVSAKALSSFTRGSTRYVSPAASTSTAPSGGGRETMAASTSTAASGGAQEATTSTTSHSKPGIYQVWGSNVTSGDVIGGQIVLDWSKWEPSRKVFDWTVLDAALRFYAGIGKSVTVQFNSAGLASKPVWIYDYVPKCGSVSFGVVGTQDIPKYWTSAYLAIMQEAVSALANHLHNSPYKSVVLGVRAAPNLIGTELWRVPAGSPCANSWSVTIGKQYYEQVMRQYHSTLLAAGIRPILRAVLFTEINPDPAIRTQLLGPDKSWVFATASSPDPDLPGREALDEFALQWVRTGRTNAYWEQSAHSKTSGNPVSWNYWHDLLELHKGVSFVARYASDLREAQDGDSNDAEYRASFEFVDKYAGHHTQPASSPGAWIAFRAGVRQPTGNYGWFMTQLDPAGTTVALDSNKGQSMIGPAEQRYGRYARRTDIATGKASFFLKLDSTFKQSIACGSARINITYLDTGTGSWAARWAAGANDVRVVNKTNSGRWRVATIDVSGASFAGALENGSDLLLQARTGDTTFHMVEVSRLERC